MRRAVLSIAITLLLSATALAAGQFRQLPVDVYLDKVKGGWAGQMIGVSFGAPTEFQACGRINDGPLDWTPQQVSNSLHQDDLYVEMSFLEAIEKYGLGITYKQAGQAFAVTKFGLCHANAQGRENVQKGIMPPESGLPPYNPHYCDIDFQIESDMLGLINPGLPKSLARECNIFGRIMNSGEGLYGGMFISAMYSDAFFESDVEKVIQHGLRAIPESSDYSRTIRDVIRWYHADPADWRKTWQLVQDKWAAHPSGHCSTDPRGADIDANLNGAYVIIGLLYGENDLALTLEITTRCGQDSDCNPSSAAGVLGTILGCDAIPGIVKSGISGIADQKFDFVKYSYKDLAPACLKVARQSIIRAGGYSKTVNGKEMLFIPMQ